MINGQWESGGFHASFSVRTVLLVFLFLFFSPSSGSQACLLLQATPDSGRRRPGQAARSGRAPMHLSATKLAGTYGVLYNLADPLCRVLGPS